MTAAVELQTALADLREGRLAVVWALPGGRLQTVPREEVGSPASAPSPCGILPGSFNPLHEGHTALRDAAERFFGGPVCYELSIVNAEKPPLDVSILLQCCGQFPRNALAVTRAATFAEKATLFPGTTFVVGLDTAERILQPRFYDGSERGLAAAMEGIRSAGCRFLVAGRRTGERFRTLADLAVAADLRDLFVALPAEEFRVDLASSDLRSDDESP